MNADDVRFRIVRLIEQRPEITQRELAAELGVSLGKVNYCLRALAEKGHVKLTRFRRRSNKMHYAYLLTPAGVQAKASATLQFLRSKVEEYERLRLEIEELSAELRVDTEQASQRDEVSST
ncbi:MAG: MarR family EPS-associated transcriptional regulator [Sinimarinibacterium flocculans]|uniref:MarR family EPS-associated transcriptional regulator n=1 Tax=Sinimarinibacterium flocculans TaxID=985250 RepID=UPI003C3F61C2